jgi:hypothetical protein
VGLPERACGPITPTLDSRLQATSCQAMTRSWRISYRRVQPTRLRSLRDPLSADRERLLSRQGNDALFAGRFKLPTPTYIARDGGGGLAELGEVTRIVGGSVRNPQGLAGS